MPAKPSVVCLYLSSLVVQCVSTSVLDSAFYSIKRFHDVSLKCNPCEDKLVKMCYEGSKRILSKPINKKQPITVEMLHKIVDNFGSNYSDLSGLRVCTICILGFSGFFRYNELSNITMNDISFSDTHVEINISKSKTDIYRRGNKVVIAKTGNKLCPVNFLKKYIEAANLTLHSCEYLFTSIQFIKSLQVHRPVNKFKPLSYTRAREILLSALKTVGYDESLYGLHSLRSGGVSAAAKKK